MNKLLLFPFGGNSREALSIIEQINVIKNTWHVLGFIDDDRKKWGDTYRGIKVLGGRDIFKDFESSRILALPGNPRTYLSRKKIIDSLDVKEERFATIIHPSASISEDSKVGINSVIMANVVLTCNVTIGDHCIILPNTVISHDSLIGSYSCLGSNVSISGDVTIGQECYIASGSTISDGLIIEDEVLVGLGSNVINDVANKLTVAGNPARILA